VTPPPAIVDTNLVVSGVLTSREDAATRRVLDNMLDAEFRFYLSVERLSEYRQVLLRPRLTSRHGISDEQIDTLLEEIAFHAVFRDPPESHADAPDPGDQHLWALLGLLPDAPLVTGDTELVTNAPPDASVLSSADYLELIE
jgi:predicted nucleic acid-binding protein